MLLAASWYFYMCWKPEFIVLLLLSTMVDYFCGLGIEKRRRAGKPAGSVLAVSLAMNLGLLFFFKYMNFFGETLTALCRAVSILFSAPALDIILPVGISFYTFQTLSYTIDVYRGKMAAERDFVTFALFVSFFPQLVAGPIEKASNLLPQLKEKHPFSYDDVTWGLKLMAWGFFKKMVIADQLAILVVDPVYNHLSDYKGGVLVFATCAFAVQIYCDFGGYSDIARGCAKTMGVDLMVNFKAPYFAVSLTEFWRRWHISLTGWFREYVYIPLGGNRKGLGKKLLFVAVTFFLSGLWHGAGWTFVAWGLLQAVYLDAEALLAARRKETAPPPGFLKRVLGRLATFALCCFSWIFFRAGTVKDAMYIVRYSISGGKNLPLYIKNAFLNVYPGEIMALTMLLSLLILFAFDFVNERQDTIRVISAWPVWLRWPVYVGFILFLIVMIPKAAAVPFIYFQF